MYKVLIADDETLDLDGMKTFIPWKELGMEVVGAVTNGFAARELLDREPIDVLVTDVHMPNMSGLELARHARERQSDVKVVFVSGYQNFHYVKEALSLKAYSYVLKPMDDRELTDALRRIRGDLDEARKRADTERDMRRKLLTAEEPAAERSAESAGGKNANLIRGIVAYMKDRLDRPLTLREVADEFGFSPNYLGQLFKEATGSTFHEQLASMRMKKAGELLRDPKLRIYEVAYRVGYRYMPYFSKQFKETYRMTPAEFRARPATGGEP
ncbi:response regulator transcription factor [Paenibacillus flagellatus]|uniref:DNA-binding response regulator n=1 Tax=Paenibacillus flagellatus TaxID=2211139 RepID=A0A2V5KMM4_9BACL|nr:response regulator [Paenibacillus flagellatus]PYI52227.1 DNA-binding response regulator [Paenibacillus flagellatus]